MDKRPNSKVNLDRAIQRIYGTGAKYVEIRSMIANTIVGQFLPEGVVKGGSALRLRYGLENTRVTVDFDTSHRNRLEDFINTISSGLKEGWSDFSGEVVSTMSMCKMEEGCNESTSACPRFSFANETDA